MVWWILWYISVLSFFFRTYETWTCQHCSQYNLMLSHIIKQQQQQNHAMNNHYIVRVQTPYDGSKSYIVPYEKWNVFVRNLREYVYILFLFFIFKKKQQQQKYNRKERKTQHFFVELDRLSFSTPFVRIACIL